MGIGEGEEEGRGGRGKGRKRAGEERGGEWVGGTEEGRRAVEVY